MKKVLFLMVLFSALMFGQYRDSGFPVSTVKDGIVNNQGTSLFGIFNTSNFQMHHSYSLSYSSFGNNGLALGVYTNSMSYKFADNLNVQADISLMHSPYSTLGQEFQKSITGIYLSKAAINYRPWKDVEINLQYRNLPYYYSGYNGFYNGLGYERDPFWGY